MCLALLHVMRVKDFEAKLDGTFFPTIIITDVLYISRSGKNQNTPTHTDLLRVWELLFILYLFAHESLFLFITYDVQ